MRKKLSLVINLDDETNNKVRSIIKRLQEKNLPVTWIEGEKFQIQLVYLGAVSQEAQKAAEQSASLAMNSSKPLKLELGFLDFFLKLDKISGSLIFLSILDNNKELKNFHKLLSKNLLEKGFSPAGHFRPHIPLGILKRQRHEHAQIKMLDQVTQLDLEESHCFEVNSIYLVELLNENPLNTKFLTLKKFAFGL